MTDFDKIPPDEIPPDYVSFSKERWEQIQHAFRTERKNLKDQISVRDSKIAALQTHLAAVERSLKQYIEKYGQGLKSGGGAPREDARDA